MEEMQMLSRALAIPRWVACGLIVSGALVAAGCGPGSNDAKTSSPQSNGATASDRPTCGKAPGTLKGYFETGFPMPKALTEEVTKQYPNVKWQIRADQLRSSPRTRRVCSRTTHRT